eukprot:g3976.t1
MRRLIRSFHSSSSLYNKTGRNGVILPNRSLLSLTGADRFTLLQDLTTVQIDLESFKGDDNTDRAIHCGFLNNKGRIIANGIILNVHEPSSRTTSTEVDAEKEASIVIDCESSLVDGLRKHLKRYKFRKKVKIKDITEDYSILAHHEMSPPNCNTGGGEGEDGTRQTSSSNDVTTILSVPDPRTPLLGYRSLIAKSANNDDINSNDHSNDLNHYVRRQHLLGIVEHADSIYNHLPLECQLDRLHGVSFDKGCYLGQETTAMAHFRGRVRKRYYPVMLIAKNNSEILHPNLCHAFHSLWNAADSLKTSFTMENLTSLNLERQYDEEEENNPRPKKWGKLIEVETPNGQDSNQCLLGVATLYEDAVFKTQDAGINESRSELQGITCTVIPLVEHNGIDYYVHPIIPPHAMDPLQAKLAATEDEQIK